jgi:outer membrane lipoprotein-sorting protein
MKWQHWMIACTALTLLAVGSAPHSAQAKPKTPANEATAGASAAIDAEDVARIERYLMNIRTITSDFVQIAPDGNATSGKMFVKRPNKMRWVYDPPTPVLMVTRGNLLTYYDFELKQVSDVPLDSTLLSFFASDDIKFGQTVKVHALEKDPGLLRVMLVQADNPKLGLLTLEFTDAPLTLRNFVIKDAQGKVTSVSLTNTRFDEPLDDKIFEFIDPRVKGRQKHRSGTDAR